MVARRDGDGYWVVPGHGVWRETGPAQFAPFTAVLGDRIPDPSEHDRRVTELLEANAREVERRREAEAEVGRLRGLLMRFAKEAFAAQILGATAIEGDPALPVTREGEHG